ncbi:MAG TPA: hypothetical protein ENJ23_02930, partial [Bacteroidetes bacterium]|nr:hypothetical protein [Bacteroidota bacterium]
DSSFNPNEDAIVRVSIHNLRKKLEAYYLHEGKHAKTRIEIPKGRYEVVFNTTQTNARRLLFSRKSGLILLIAALAGILAWSLFKVKSLEGNRDSASNLLHHPVWRSILQSPLPKLIVLGDDFFFLATENNREIIVRHHDVNSTVDLRRLIRNAPEDSIKEKTPYAFVPMSSIKPLVYILPIFRGRQKVAFQYSSGLESKDLLNNDIIFFGTFRNLYMLHQVVKNMVPKYHIGVGKNSLTLAERDSLVTYTLSGNPEKEHSDYCFVSKLRGPNGNTILLFVSFFETGMIGAVQYMTDPQSLDRLKTQFQQRFGEFPPYFEILFKTSGFSRTAFTTHVVYLDKINPESFVW